MYNICCYTVNRERFAGPNFCSFEEDRESFFMNILHECLFNNYWYNISAPGQWTAKVFPRNTSYDQNRESLAQQNFPRLRYDMLFCFVSVNINILQYGTWSLVVSAIHDAVDTTNCSMVSIFRDNLWFIVPSCPGCYRRTPPTGIPHSQKQE